MMVRAKLTCKKIVGYCLDDVWWLFWWWNVFRKGGL